MLPALVFLALAVFAGALFWSPHAGRAAYLHLMLAAGAMPLIFGAMSHFIPVLTRTREAEAGVGLVPLVALAGGALAVAAFSLPGLVWGWQAGALLATAAALALFLWSRKRRAAMLGSPHPCLGWYEAALACLALALLAILAGGTWPQHFSALRRFHLHLNTLGFIGLTAVSTLAVLLPTVIGRPDPQAAQRLRRGLPWAAAGTLLIAAGSAWFAVLAWLGAAFWAIVLTHMAVDWLHLYRREIFALHGAAPLLATALAGFALSLLLGAGRVVAEAGGMALPDPTAAYAAGFMLPLVSGAASQLLPVWLRPGVQNAWHGELRKRLARFNGLRALLFLISGITAALGQQWGLVLGAATLAWFLLQAITVLARTTIFNQGKQP
jgi:hypothetical protein